MTLRDLSRVGRVAFRGLSSLRCLAGGLGKYSGASDPTLVE